jgi:hypothetical protein
MRVNKSGHKKFKIGTGLRFFGLAAVVLCSQTLVRAGDGTPGPSPSPSPVTYQPFLSGLMDAFGQALTSPAYTPPQPGATQNTRRGAYSSPFDDPPFFTSDYQIGGTPIIGDHNEATVWPLMKAVYGSGPFGQWLKDNRINFYG